MAKADFSKDVNPLLEIFDSLFLGWKYHKICLKMSGMENNYFYTKSTSVEYDGKIAFFPRG